MQNNIFAKSARKATTLSPLMENREKMPTEEIINKYPDGITVTCFDIIGTGENAYPVFIFEEEPDKFAFGGYVFKQIVDAWVNQFEGAIDDCANSLKASGGVKMIFKTSTTKNKRTVTTIEIPD